MTPHQQRQPLAARGGQADALADVARHRRAADAVLGVRLDFADVVQQRRQHQKFRIVDAVPDGVHHFVAAALGVHFSQTPHRENRVFAHRQFVRRIGGRKVQHRREFGNHFPRMPRARRSVSGGGGQRNVAQQRQKTGAHD